MIKFNDADQPQEGPPLLQSIWREGEQMPEKSTAVKMLAERKRLSKSPTCFCMSLHFSFYEIFCSKFLRLLCATKGRFIRILTKEQSAGVCVVGYVGPVLPPSFLALPSLGHISICICV